MKEMKDVMKDVMKDGMNDLDSDLKHALRREEAPAGFADRVLLRVAEPPQAEHRTTSSLLPWDPVVAGLPAERSRPGPFGPGITGGSKGPALQGVGDGATRPRLPFVQWAAAAALVAAVAGGVNYIAKQEERAEGEAAKERVVLALHIAGSKLQLVQTRISRMHAELGPNREP